MSLSAFELADFNDTWYEIFTIKIHPKHYKF
jgi:hypothetical protein